MTNDSGSFAGRQLGGYEVLSLLGVGGMGEVYRARDVRLGREVALKLLARSATSDPGYLHRFEDEARLASGINHPNIVTIYGVGEEADVAYIAMELVTGRTLRDVLTTQALSVSEVLNLALPLTEAIAAAHRSGIMHRDLKPENVMVNTEGLVKVLDFGLGKRPHGLDAPNATATRAALTREGMILGTIGYMAPEQAVGRAATFAADQFSFGVMLYEMLCGRLPFERETLIETLSAIIRETPKDIRSINPRVTPALQTIVDRCLAKDPAERFADATELATELRKARDMRTSDATLPPFTPPAASPWSETRLATSIDAKVSRRRALWVAGGTFTLAAAGFGAWSLWPRDTGIRKLAVLPFANAVDDRDVEYLCDGITESLIQQISRLPSLTVMARSTVFNFKGKPIDPRTAGRQLGVDAILTGTVTERSGRVRITAELVEVSTGTQLWGKSYDRDAADVVSVQDEIASAILDEGIKLTLSNEERRTLAQHATDDPQAYESYLRARHALFKQSEEGLLEARELFERATARDTRFAPAYTGLAGTYVEAALDGFERPTEAFPLANRSNRRALDIDPRLPEAHSTAAEVAFFFDWDWATAEREWAIAYEATSSGQSLTHDLLGYAISRWALGRPDEALRVIRRIRQVDPLTVVFAVREADYLSYAGQFDAAAALYEKTMRDEPTAAAYFGLAELRRAQGRFDEAIEARRLGYEVDGDESLRDVFAIAKGAEGHRKIELKSAGLELEALERRTDRYASPVDLARAHAELGHADQAFTYLNAAFQDHAPGLVFLKVDRAWDAIRQDRRFLVALQRVGLP